MAKRTIGYAVIGLGHIAQDAVLPAFKHAKRTKLVALVSSDHEKLETLGREYEVGKLFSYDELEQCLALPEVDAVYIALPNDLHAEFTERCAAKGKHVLCEKPMELSADACERMIRACDDAKVKLMIGYRLHFEPGNLFAVDQVMSGNLGEPKVFTSEFSYQVQPGNIRTQEERGGGALWDIGIYCVNASRYLFRAEPTEVFAFATTGKDERFREIEESVSCTMRFPDQKVASFVVSYGTAPTSTFRIIGTKGDLRLENAYEYVGGKKARLTIDEETKEKKFKGVDQFAPELEYFSKCIRENLDPEPDGYEGLADVRIIAAIHESIHTGAPVKVPPTPVRRYPDRSMEYDKPAVKDKELVNVEAPSQ